MANNFPNGFEVRAAQVFDSNLHKGITIADNGDVKFLHRADDPDLTEESLVWDEDDGDIHIKDLKVDTLEINGNPITFPISPAEGGTGLDTSASTGVPVIDAGTWSVQAQLEVSKGGTGIDLTGDTGVLIVDAGVVSNPAQLSVSKGGTGIDLTGDTGVLVVDAGVVSNPATLAPVKGGLGADFSAGDGLVRFEDGVATQMPLDRNYIYGLTLSNNVADAPNDIDIAIGATISDDTLDVDLRRMTLVAALTKQLDAVWAVGTNAGMRASGAAIANTTYHIFLIKRPDTGVVDIAADTSVTGANIAANTDAAYTKKRRIGSILRESATIVPFVQDGDQFMRSTPIQAWTQTNPGTAAVTRTLQIPLGLRLQAIIIVSVSDTTPVGSAVYISDLSLADVAADPNVNVQHRDAATGSGATGPIQVFTNTSAQIRSRNQASDANLISRGGVYGWIDKRGKSF
jgi:hypothetical protein